ncbi:PREDICTED: lipid transfer-like protein VAS isoform X1 [Camelina sativa]|uniref:Lipid transfer-like protein VAS isoform X1 n=1 Tax=Camelina sativa TaxID=90675 RepID=A0ABM0SZ82_CAMSA|nr:PREDICTED: lipid transfer-like protein VAS isoform X1 [Camelina sativa]
MMKVMMIFAAAMTVMALVSVPAVEAQTECVSKLVPCFNFLNVTTKPSKVCCDSIKEAVEKELSCLCTIYTTPGLLANFNVSTDQALGLSNRCDVKTNLSACNAKGAPSPKASLPPPAGNNNTKNDAGAGNKLAGYGVVTTVSLSLISSIFF